MRIYVSNFVQLFCYVLHFIQKSPLFQPQKKKDIVPVLTQTAKISLFSKYLLFFYLFCKIYHNLKAEIVFSFIPSRSEIFLLLQALYMLQIDLLQPLILLLVVMLVRFEY